MALKLLLKCGNIKETKAFYSELLESNVSGSGEGTCTVEKEGGEIIFTEEDLWLGYPKCTGAIYFFLHDLDAYYESVKGRVIIRWPVEDMPYGTREFGIMDCNEYTLAFAKKI